METLRVWLKSRAAILGGCSVNLCYDMECAHLLWNVPNFNLSTTGSGILAGAGPEPDWIKFGRNRTGPDFTISKTRPDSTRLDELAGFSTGVDKTI